ncbi:hypothetical protein LTR17_022345 [Elasticomyces elasticus]|nr:hypothetical protein LTR17_022345 [Elasticomyces elasticus]
MAAVVEHQPEYESWFNIHETLAQPYYSVSLRDRFQIDNHKPPAPVENEPVKFADIDYDVDEVKFRALSKARVAAGGLEAEVPPFWPKRVRGPLVWTPEKMTEDIYVVHLTDEDKAEILEALAHFKEQDLDGSEVSRESFPLPTLSKKLDAMCTDVYEGHGFSVLRGLNPEVFSAEDVTVIYLGLASYIGETRGKQDQRGSMIMHIIKLHDARDKQYCADKPFHTDTVTDCICLFAFGVSARGGCSFVAPAWQVYNEIAATRPDIIHVLSRPDWPFDTHGRDPAYIKRAVLYHHKGKIIFSFSRRLLVGHPPHDPRTLGIPGLTEAQAEALDAVHFAAKKFEVRPTMQRGDLRFINNMGLLHCREAFEDDSNNARHLIRLWLHNELMCWKLPEPLRLAWARVFEDEDRKEYFDIMPPKKDGVLLRVAGTSD